MSVRKYERYMHHDNLVWVETILKGKHRDICLCFNCTKLNVLDNSKNCPIANALYANCVKYGLTTPVTECPNFSVKDEFNRA